MYICVGVCMWAFVCVCIFELACVCLCVCVCRKRIDEYPSIASKRIYEQMNICIYWIFAYIVSRRNSKILTRHFVFGPNACEMTCALRCYAAHPRDTHTHTHTHTQMCHDVFIHMPWFIDVCAPTHLVCHVLWLAECVGDDVRPGLRYRHLCHRCGRQGDCPRHIDRHYHNHDQIWRRR